MAMVLFSKKDLCTVTSKSTTDLSGVFFLNILFILWDCPLLLHRHYLTSEGERWPRALPPELSEPWGLLILTSLHLSSICLFTHFFQTEVVISLLFIVLPCYLLLPDNLPTGLQSADIWTCVPRHKSSICLGLEGTLLTWSISHPWPVSTGYWHEAFLFLATWAAQMPSLNYTLRSLEWRIHGRSHSVIYE